MRTGFFMSDSIGQVKASKVTLEGKLDLDCGQALHDIELVYETYGKLNSDASNAILICHASVSYTHLRAHETESNLV